jgi:hypothetical protein
MKQPTDVYNWTEVMGSNMVYPTVEMLYTPTVISRKTRLKSEGYKVKPRFLNVRHDIHFVVWRMTNILREFKAIDEPKLREVFELVICQLNNND